MFCTILLCLSQYSNGATTPLPKNNKNATPGGKRQITIETPNNFGFNFGNGGGFSTTTISPLQLNGLLNGGGLNGFNGGASLNSLNGLTLGINGLNGLNGLNGNGLSFSNGLNFNNGGLGFGGLNLGAQNQFSGASIGAKTPGLANLNNGGGAQNAIFYKNDGIYAGSSGNEIVQKHIYIHVPPAEVAEPEQRSQVIYPPPQKHYKIIFIKAPAPPKPTQPTIQAPPQNEEKTLVYVLVKKPDDAPEIKIEAPPPTKPSKPEVYFIKYKSQKDAASSISTTSQQNGVNFGGALLQGALADAQLGNRQQIALNGAQLNGLQYGNLQLNGALQGLNLGNLGGITETTVTSAPLQVTTISTAGTTNTNSADDVLRLSLNSDLGSESRFVGSSTPSSLSVTSTYGPAARQQKRYSK